MKAFILISNNYTSQYFFQESQDTNSNPVRTEEAKLKAKYPGLGQKPGGSDFLMKRMQKGVSTISTTEKSMFFKTSINS